MGHTASTAGARAVDPDTVLADAGARLLGDLAAIVERHPDLRTAPGALLELLDEIAGHIRRARGRVRVAEHARSETPARPPAEPAPAVPQARVDVDHVVAAAVAQVEARAAEQLAVVERAAAERIAAAEARADAAERAAATRLPRPTEPAGSALPAAPVPGAPPRIRFGRRRRWPVALAAVLAVITLMLLLIAGGRVQDVSLRGSVAVPAGICRHHARVARAPGTPRT